MADFFNVTKIADVTLNGMEQWMKFQYEQLGWMTLAYSNNMEEKVISYIKANNNLKFAIEKRLTELNSKDVEIKKDLFIIHRKITHLISTCNKLFNKKALSNNVCVKCNEKIHESRGGFKKTSKSSRQSKTSKTSKTSNVPKSSRPSKIPELLSNKTGSHKILELPKKSSKKFSKSSSKKMSR
jgi:hypothetical protein